MTQCPWATVIPFASKPWNEIKLPEIQSGEYFIVKGQIAYVAEVGESSERNHRPDSRLRVIYDNGTESNLLKRSFQRALYRDAAGRLITNPDLGPLFAEERSDDDLESGTITFCEVNPTIRFGNPVRPREYFSFRSSS